MCIRDSRGAVGVTERASYFARMRDLTRQVSDEYRQQRQRLEYPWLPDNDEPAAAVSAALKTCLLYTSPSPRDRTRSRMPSSA